MPAYPAKKGGFLLGTWLVDRINLFFRLRRYIKWVQERWFILAACVVISVGIAFYQAHNTPDMFRAESKIGVAPRIQTPNPTAAQYQEEISTFYDKQIEYMTSPHVLGRVEDQLKDGRPRKEGFSYHPSAYKGPASLVMQVDSTDFEFARKYAVLWAHEFMAFKTELRGSTLTKSAEEIRKQMKGQQDALDAAREALTEFQTTNRIGSIQEAGAAAQQRLDNLLSQLQDIKIHREQLENRKPEEIAESGGMGLTSSSSSTNSAAGSSDRSTDPMAVAESAKYGDMKIRLRGLEAELQNRSETLQPTHPYMKQLVMDVATTKQQIKYFLDEIEAKRINEISSLKSDEGAMLPIIDEARKDSLAKATTLAQFQHLKDNESNIKQTLDNLDKQLQSINAAPADEGFFSIDTEGTGDNHPVSPNRPKMMLGGFMFGVVIGMALIYLLGRLDDRLELAEDIEVELQERILGQIPLVNLRNYTEKRLIVSKLDKHNMFAEALRGVRSAIMFGTNDSELFGQDSERKVLIVSSAAPGDGKTTITTNLAITLGLAGHRVLLIDGDLRRGNIHSYFGWERGQGFAEVLAGTVSWETVAIQSPVPTLKVITTGQMPSNPGELLIGPHTKPMVKEVREKFDYVIVDCPPLTSIDDSFSLARLADGVLFVIMSGQTSMRFAKTALAAVRQRGGKILGMVLNGIRPDNPYYYYQQYYYSYYTIDDSTEGQKRADSEKATMVRRRRAASREEAGDEGRTLNPGETRTRDEVEVETPSDTPTK